MSERSGAAEQSHKDEMRAAVLGDFDRLRSRREADAADESARPIVPAPSAPVVDPTPRISWIERLGFRR